MTIDVRDAQPPGERVAPELAIARLDLRQLCLLAAHPMLTAVERQVVGGEHGEAVAAAEAVLARHATRPDRGVGDVARLFLAFYYVYPNHRRAPARRVAAGPGRASRAASPTRAT